MICENFDCIFTDTKRLYLEASSYFQHFTVTTKTGLLLYASILVDKYSPKLSSSTRDTFFGA